MAPETRSGRAREPRASETASPPAQRPRLTRAGTRGDAPTRGRSGQVNEDVESRFQHLASSVQNDVMQLKAATGEDKGGTPIQDPVVVVPRMTRRRAREECGSETALPSLQRTRLTRGGNRGEALTSGRSGKVNEDVKSRFQHLASSVQNDMQLNRAMDASLDYMSGNKYAAASSSRMISTGNEAVEPLSRHDGPNTLGTYKVGQDNYTRTGHDESGTATNPEDATDRDEGTGQGDQAAGQPKRQRKPRRRNKLGTNRIVINRVSEVGLPVSPKKAGSRGNAPTSGRSGQVNEDVKSRFQHLAKSVQNDVMQLEPATGEDGGGARIQDLVAGVPPLTRRRAREACASETVLPSLQRTRLTCGGSRGEAPTSGRSDMSGNGSAAASSSRTISVSDEAVEPSSHHGGPDALGTYTDGQDDYTSTVHDESGTATNPEGATDRDEGTGQAARQPKKQRNRRPNMLGTDRIVINRVSEAGLPLSPKKAEQGYSNGLGCILRETVSINETNLRSKANENLRALLISKLHTHYKFPDESLDETTPVNNTALCKWTKLLSTWKSKAKSEYLEKDYETEIKKKWPSVSEEDWNLFKQHCETPEVKEMEKWGKEMRARNIGNHTLGSRGYPGKKPKWDKQDAEFAAAGIPNPFKEFENPRENDYIRGRCKYDEETKTWVLDEKTAKVKELLRQYHVESQSSQESESSARWDDPLNRSINVVLGKDPKTRPAYGRVNGVGLNEKWGTHYPEDRELARQRRRAGRASFESKLAGMREELKEEMREEVEMKAKAMATAQVMEMWPDLIEAVKHSLASGQTAPPPSAVTLAPANVVVEKEPRPGAHHSSHSVPFMG